MVCSKRGQKPRCFYIPNGDSLAGKRNQLTMGCERKRSVRLKYDDGRHQESPQAWTHTIMTYSPGPLGNIIFSRAIGKRPNPSFFVLKPTYERWLYTWGLPRMRVGGSS